MIMTARLLMLALVAGTMSVAAETPPSPSNASEDSEKAYQKGLADARNDLKSNRLALETFGLPAPSSGEYRKLLLERYGIDVRSIGGCVVDKELVGHARGYNEVAMKEIERRFGIDIFEKTQADAVKRFEASRQR